MTATESDTFEKVQRIVADALGVDLHEVTREARLTEDLGAESLDYLDIAFQLEKAFGITIDAGELMLTNVIVDERYVRDSRITDAGMVELRRRLPQLDLGTLDRSRDVRDLMGIFTVEALTRFAHAKRAGSC